MLIYLAFLATAIYHTLNTNDPVTLTACFPSILPHYIPLSQPPKASQTCYPSSPNLSNPLLKSRSWPFSTTNRWNHNNRVAWWWSTWQAAGLIYIHKRLNSIELKTPKISKLIDSLEPVIPRIRFSNTYSNTTQIVFGYSNTPSYLASCMMKCSKWKLFTVLSHL
jgi:hypothetical protein